MLDTAPKVNCILRTQRGCTAWLRRSVCALAPHWSRGARDCPNLCDWDVAARLVAQSTIPVILGGGISQENAAAGIKKVCPAGVDSCTETNARDSNGRPIRFKKDVEKIKQLVAEVRRAEQDIKSQNKSRIKRKDL